MSDPQETMKLWLVSHDAYEDLVVFAPDDVTAAKLWHSFYEVQPSSLLCVRCFQLPGRHDEVKVARAIDFNDLRVSEVLGSQIMNYHIN